MTSHITLIIGPMFSGKTEKLIEIINSLDSKCVIVKYSMDHRYGGDGNKLVSRSGAFVDSSDKTRIIECTNLMGLIDNTHYDLSEKYIFIDEGQFFSDIVEFCTELKNKKIFISALNGDAKRCIFGKIYMLLPICASIIHLTGICAECGDRSSFTKKYICSASEMVGNVEVDIGGEEKYKALCLSCYCASN